LTAGWRVEITPRARRDLHRIDPPVRQRITDALDRLVADPPTGDVVKLTGREEWRLRVGDWRVRFRLDSQQRTVVVHRVLPRDAPTATDAEPRSAMGHDKESVAQTPPIRVKLPGTSNPTARPTPAITRDFLLTAATRRSSENRGVPGSSPGLAIRDDPASEPFS
jgi:mRNA interferase RelE/StbE